MANRSLAPRTRSQYSNAQHGRRDSNLPFDDRTVRTDICRVNVIRPNYEKGPMIVRPWPGLSEDNPDILVPGRVSVKSHDQSQWIVRAPVVKFLGLKNCERFSFILYGPWEKQDRAKNNPVHILFFGSKAANKAGKFGNGQRWDSEWNQFMLGDAKSGPEISGPTATWYMQGTVYVNGERDYTNGERQVPLGWDPADDLPIIEMSVGAGDKLVDLFDVEKKDTSNVDEENRPWDKFLFGDPVGVYSEKERRVKGGLLLAIFNPRKTRVIKPKKEGEPMMFDILGNPRPRYTTTWDGQIPKFQGYEAGVMRSFKSADGVDFTAELTEEQTDIIKSKWQFWWDDPGNPNNPGMLRVPSDEEQMVMIAKGFKAAPKLIEFCFADHPDYLNDEVMGILRERRSAVMPGEADDTASAAPPSGRVDPTQRRPKPRLALAPVEAEFEQGQEHLDAVGEPTTNEAATDTGEFATGEFEPEQAAVDQPAEEAVAEEEFAAAEGLDDPIGEPVAEAGEPAAEPAGEFDDAAPGEPAAEPPDPDDYYGLETPAEPAAESVEAEAPPAEEFAEEATSTPATDVDPQEAADQHEAAMAASMNAARRSSQRTSTPAAPPVTSPVRPAAQKPAAAPARPAAAPARSVTQRPAAAPARPAAVPVRPAAAPARPAQARPAAAPPARAAGKPATPPARKK